MKKEEVPQDKDKLLEGKFEWMMYATNKEGKYEQVNSIGWEAENIALEQTWDEINERVTHAIQQVKNGTFSPILYYMEKNLMDVSMLANYTGFWKFCVNRHLKPSNFSKLSNKKLEIYSRVFNISIEQLKNPQF